MDTSKKEYHVTDFTVKIVVVDMLVVLRKLNPSPVWLRSLRMLSAAELSILCSVSYTHLTLPTTPYV